MRLSALLIGLLVTGALPAKELELLPEAGSVLGLGPELLGLEVPGARPEAGITGLGQRPDGTFDVEALSQGWAGREAPLLPVEDEAAEEGAAPSAPATYTVRSGDSLWKISARLCGDGARWRELYEANRGALHDPNVLRAGQVLEVPCGTSEPESAPGAEPEPDPAAPPPPLPDRRPEPPPPPPVPDAAASPESFVTHFPLPVGEHWMFKNFGQWRDNHTRQHDGIDLPAVTGTPITAVASGTVVKAGRNGGYGFSVLLRHDPTPPDTTGYFTRYAHMSKEPKLKVGQRVEGGDYLGPVGSTGYSEGPHLHFEVLRNGDPVNPLHYCALDRSAK